MAVSHRLDLRQTQSLVMTPQLQQAIKLLQLSNAELAAYLNAEVERNPLLERIESDTDSFASDSGPETGGAPGDAGGEATGFDLPPVPDSADLTAAATMPDAADAPLDTDYDNLYDDGPADTWPDDAWTGGPGGGTGAGHTGDEGRQGIDQQAAGPISLRQHLLDQVQIDLDDPAERLIAVHLIDMLDDCGYLAGDLAELAAQLGCSPEHIEATLRKVQRFDPPGIFARSLSECLALQLAERDRLDPAMAALLDHLPLVAARDYPTLCKVCGVDRDDLADMLNEIRALDPKPAQTFDGRAAEPVIPDILMRAAPDGGWIIELNGDTLPRVLVNTHYHAHVAARVRTKAERDYVNQQFQSANWLVRSLHQRATTIIKVATEIVRQQDAFFRKGIRHLRPLTLRDIAEAIDMHESTVSRVTTNKYMATPRGMFELKYFFTAAIAGAGGGAHSAEAVRHRIKALIEAETPDAVLSDDALVARLRAEGIDIARRTVAKYREAMRIPSSVQRRRDKKLHA
ncbi:MAG: RNA polymerase sigma-54 factor [Planctomycetota bacterium]|nr:MAG: RNA polymerase sigma-54 factor [Planctomycetota bacterium]